MNKKYLFAVTNALLVGIVGLLVGLFCKDIFATGTGVVSFVCLLIALCIPSVVYFLASKAGSPSVIICLLLMFAELGINIAFMVKPVDGKICAITQAAVVGAFLIATLVFIAVGDKKENK